MNIRTILIIEDEDILATNVLKLLKINGFDVRSARNGQEAVEKLADERPDLIMCDIKMPIMNGYQTLSYVRNSSLLADVPFVFFSAYDPDKKILKELAYEGFIEKPYYIKTVLEVIEDIKNNKITSTPIISMSDL